MTATTGDPGSAILASEISSQLMSFLDPCMYPTHCSVNTHLAMQFFLVGAWQLAMVWNELTDRFSYLPKCKARKKRKMNTSPNKYVFKNTSGYDTMNESILDNTNTVSTVKVTFFRIGFSVTNPIANPLVL